MILLEKKIHNKNVAHEINVHVFITDNNFSPIEYSQELLHNQIIWDLVNVLNVIITQLIH
jgi:hypothetical protein